MEFTFNIEFTFKHNIWDLILNLPLNMKFTLIYLQYGIYHYGIYVYIWYLWVPLIWVLPLNINMEFTFKYNIWNLPFNNMKSTFKYAIYL